MDALNYEEKNVHSVYERIATHFSSTRYKPWPVVEKFLQGLPPGSIGFDAGCGNGKYFSVNKDIFVLGSDRSSNLVNIARKSDPGQDALIADSLRLPHPIARLDFGLSIAVIHHFSNRDRRVEAITEILASLKKPTTSGEVINNHGNSRGDVSNGGKALIFVWALEQKTSRRGWDEGDNQDVLVPWVLKGTHANQSADLGANGGGDQTFHRYYHLYCEGELVEDVQKARGTVIESGYERDNWYAVVTPKGD